MESENCIFCKIVKGEIPCYKVYEDDNFLAFLDITPFNKGHTLLIPKKHYRWVWEIEKDYSLVCNKIATALQEVFDTEWIISFVVGEQVPHAHFHFVPRFENDGHGNFIDINKRMEVNSEEMIKLAEEIQSKLA